MSANPSPDRAATAQAAAQTPWMLMARRFRRHALAVIGMHILVLLYLLAIFAEFVAPYPSAWRDQAHSYNPPQPPSWSWRDGLHLHDLHQHKDPVTYQKTYVTRSDAVVPLGFFVHGEPFRLWGLIPMSTHLFGVDRAEWERRHPGAESPHFYLFGADQYGHCIFSRLIYGARVSLSIGLVAIAVTFVLGLSIGGISGYLGGSVDNGIQRGIEIINSFPQLPLWIALSAFVPADWSPLAVYFGITIVLSLIGWTGLARVVRGKVLALREEDYALAARLLGASHSRIIARHLLPGVTSYVIVSLTLAIPGMILGETSLSFLGIGLRPPVVSWGVMLQDCTDMNALEHYPWVLLPVLFIVAAVLAFNFVGDGLRDAADPYASK